jgi:hypothetical protein
VTTDQPLPHDDIASGHGVEESVPAARRLKQRYDGRSKVTGTARSADVRTPGSLRTRSCGRAVIKQKVTRHKVISKNRRCGCDATRLAKP